MALVAPEVFGDLLTNIITAIIILLIGFVAGKLVGSLFHKLFVAMTFNKKTKNKNGSSLPRRLSSIISLGIYIVAIILALERLKITNIVLKSILIALLVIIAGAVFFAIVNFLMNIYFGIKLLTSKKFEKGDLIKIRKIEGTVKKIGLGYTKIITSSGDIFILSNKLFFDNKFSIEKNQTKPN